MENLIYENILAGLREKKFDVSRLKKTIHKEI
jgi:hypothetical protein